MSVDLEDKPGAIYDDDKPAWKTNLHDDNLEDSFNAPSATDEDLPDGHPDKDKKSLSTSELRDKEKTSPTDLKNEASNEEAASFYSNKGRKKTSIRGRISRRQAGIGIAISTAVISGFTAVSLQAPNLVLNSLKEMLLSRVSSVQMFQTRRYRQKTYPKLKNLLSKEGRMGQKIVSELQADDYIVSFGDDNLIAGITHPNRSLSLIGDGVGDHIEEYINKKHPFKSARWKTKRMNALYNKFGVSRTSVVDNAKPRAGPDGVDLEPDEVINSRTTETILEDNESDIKANVSSDETDPEAKTADEARRAKIADEGSEVGDQLKVDRENIIATGQNIDDLPDDSITKVLANSGDDLSEEVVDAAKKAASNSSLSDDVVDGVKGTVNPLDILDKVCIVRNRLQGAVTLARATRTISLIRYATVFINAADDTRRGNADPKLINSLMKRVTSEDKNGVSIGGSTGFGYMIKSRFSKSRNESTRSSVAVDGKLTGIPGGINNGINRVPKLKEGCPYFQNPFVQVSSGVGSLAVAFFSGGSSAGAEVAAQQGAKVAIETAFKSAVEKGIFKKIGGELIKSAAKDMAFGAIMSLTELYVQRNLNLPFTGQEKGGQLGDILAAGAGASNKQRSLAAGLVPATSQQYAMAQKEYIAWHKNELKNMSFKDRMLNMDSPDSLLFNIALHIPSGATDGARKTTDGIVSMASTVLNPSKIIRTTLSLLAPKANAADEISFDEYTIKNSSGGDTDTKLATDFAGNLQMIMRSDIEDIDPEANIEALKASGDIDPDTLLPLSPAFKDHVENCVDSPDLITKIEDGDEFDCLAKKQITVKYKAHLAYLDLEDGLEAEFFPEEIAKTSSNSNSSNTPIAGGLAAPYANPIDIGLTSVIPGTSVRIATNTLPQFQNMLNAAKNDGIDLLPVSSGWRDPESQIALRKQNCPDWQNSPASACTPDTAKPGTSVHERGQAIDFGNMCYPGGKTCPGNPRWEWLTKNAEKFGFKPISQEAWHWSVSGR